MELEQRDSLETFFGMVCSRMQCIHDLMTVVAFYRGGLLVELIVKSWAISE